MSIKYALYENHLTTDPGDYMAQVQVSSSVSTDDIIELMVNQGSTVTKADIKAVLEDFTKATEQLLLDGRRVNFAGMAEFQAGISGVFNGAHDSFDKARHSVEVRVCAGSKLRNTIRSNAHMEKTERMKSLPVITVYEDLGSTTINSTVTPGNIGTLRGHRLKYDTANTDEGIYFISQADGSETKADKVQKNKPGEMVFLIPGTLTAGDYDLEVRTRNNTGELRKGKTDFSLTVV